MRIPQICLALLLTVSSNAAAKGWVNEDYELVKIADGVYSFIAPESDSGVVQSNCTLIIGDDAALVVDSGQFPSLAASMVADIKKLTPKPVRYLVNTHWHFDHVWGNGTFRDAYPGLVIISTEFTREMVDDQGPKTLATQSATNKEQASQFRKYIADGKLPDGRVVTDEMKHFFNRLADTLDHIDTDLAHTVLVPPTVGFEKELTIDLGKREVKVMWLGRANTGGDAITWVPDIKLLMAGDTVVYPTPFAFGSYMTEWPVTLQKIIDLNPAIIIPGHGPVMHDTSYLATLIALFRSLTVQVKQAADQGLSLEDTRKKIDLSEFSKRLAGDDRMRQAGFRSAFVYPGVDRAYQEAKGKMKPEAED